MVAVEGWPVEEVPYRGVVYEARRGSSFDQGEESLIWRVVGEAEEPVQEEVRIRL